MLCAVVVAGTAPGWEIRDSPAVTLTHYGPKAAALSSQSPGLLSYCDACASLYALTLSTWKEIPRSISYTLQISKYSSQEISHQENNTDNSTCIPGPKRGQETSCGEWNRSFQYLLPFFWIRSQFRNSHCISFLYLLSLLWSRTVPQHFFVFHCSALLNGPSCCLVPHPRAGLFGVSSRCTSPVHLWQESAGVPFSLHHPRMHMLSVFLI